MIAHTELLDSEDGTVRHFDVQQEGLKFGNERQLVDQMISVLNDLLGLIDRSEFRGNPTANFTRRTLRVLGN